MKYRIFTNDRGPNKYSGFAEVSTGDGINRDLARAKTAKLSTAGYPLKVLVIPQNRLDSVWIGNGITGNISRDAQKEFIIDAR